MALPVNGSTHLIPAYYSIYRPREDERLSWPSWLTYSGWLTHINGHPSAAGRAQDRESSPARDRRSTTVPRHQLCHATRPDSNGVIISHIDGFSSQSRRTCWELTPRILSRIQRTAQTVLGVYLKRTCSRVTNASSAKRVLNDYALYKSTH